jgi:O-antigen/teichoic acid export membrane protein
MSLRHEVVWTTVGSGTYLLTQYAILSALAKLGSPIMVGQFALAFGITAPVVILCQMQLRQLQVTDVRGAFVFGDYFFSRLVLSVFALAIIGSIVAIGRFPAHLKVVVGLVGLAKVLESLSDIVHGHLQQRKRMDYIAGSLVLKGILTMALFAGTLWATQSLIWAAAVLAGVWGGMFVVYDLPLLRRVSERPEMTWRPRALAELTVLALPLALTAGLGSLASNMPRYFLDALSGTQEVGLFAVATAPLTVMTLLTGSIAQASLAPAAECLQSGAFGAFSRLVIKVSAAQISIAAVSTALFVLFGEYLLTTLFAPQYGGGARILTVMSAGLTISGLGAFGAAVFAAGRMRWMQCGNVATSLAIQIPACYYLIGTSAAKGAAWAEVARMLASTLFLIGAGWWVFRRQRTRLAMGPPDPWPGAPAPVQPYRG